MGGSQRTISSNVARKKSHNIVIHSISVSPTILSGFFTFLNSTSSFQKTIKFAFFVQAQKTSHGTVVATPDEGSFDPDSGNGSASHLLAQNSSNGLAVWILVQFHDCITRRLAVQTLLRLDTKGSRGET